MINCGFFPKFEIPPKLNLNMWEYGDDYPCMQKLVQVELRPAGKVFCVLSLVCYIMQQRRVASHWCTQLCSNVITESGCHGLWYFLRLMNIGCKVD